MNVRPYKPEDFEQIKSWGEKYNAVYDPELLPPCGFIVDGVAAYFLYETLSKVCFLENMIANKDVDDATKDKALTLIVEAIIIEATKRGFKLAYACTNIPKVVERAILNGAKFEPKYVLLTKKLS